MKHDEDKASGPKRAPTRGRPFGRDNPPPRRGRKKGARNVETIVKEIALQQHAVTIEGQRRRLNTVELVLRALQMKALKCEHRAVIERDRIFDRYRPNHAKSGLLVVPEPMDEAEWIRMIEFKNARTVQPGEPDL